MTNLPNSIDRLVNNDNKNLLETVDEISQLTQDAGYNIVERNDEKPWGAYLRIDGVQADEFVKDFFGDLTPEQARQGNIDAELSPKFLIVKPGARLSLQTHARRAERWRFLTEGWYYKSKTEDAGDVQYASPGEVVQFEKGETHRLCGGENDIVVVAEIWQHVDPSNLSDEDDIVRLEDDYQR